MQRPDVTVIGLGGLGSTLAKSLAVHGIPIKSIFNRTEGRATKFAEQLNIPISGGFPTEAVQLGSLVFITVSDHAISDLASRLAGLKGSFENKLFVHCSGNAPAGLLRPLKNKGALTASFHPLQTFTRKSEPEIFEGIYFSLQGDDEAFPVLKDIAAQLGAETFEITNRQKSHLHAAAVMASNYLNTLLDAATDIGSLSGLSKTHVYKALLPLIRTTLNNAKDQGFSDSLTGPIKRGDIETVKEHIKLFENSPELCRLYCELGHQTVKLAKSSGSIGDSTAETLHNILDGKDG